jgi:lipocalin
MTDLMNTFKNMFLGVFMNPAGMMNQPATSNTSYARQFFNPEKFEGSWKEVSRTANSFQEFDGQEAIHKFKLYNNKIDHQLAQGEKKVKHTLTVDQQNKNLCFNNFLGHPRTNVFGIYDQNLNLAINDSQEYAYCILCNDDKFWMLSRPECEDNSQAINHMTNFCQKLGYKPTYTCNRYRVNHFNDSKKNTPRHSQKDDFLESFDESRYTPKDHYHDLDTKEDSSDEDCDVMVLWNCDAFPSDGSGRMISVKKDDVIRFKSTDGKPHTVAQCQILKDGNELSGFKWVPHSNPKIGSPDDSDEFNKTLKIGESGVYYLVCPVDTNHRCMRLRVDVCDEN